MSFVIEKEALIETMNAVLGSIEKKKTVPILNNIKIDCRGNQLYLTATDMDLFATSVCSVKGEQDYVTTVPGQLLFDIVKKAPDGAELKLEYNDEKKSLTISQGSSKFKLPCLEADSFPVISEGGSVSSTKLPAKSLASLIEKVRFAVSSDETRYYLNGIFMHTAEQSLKSVATDGYKLALYSIEQPENFEFSEGVILPRKCINEVKRIIDLNPNLEAVEIIFSQNKAKFIFGSTILISKLIDGKFPDYVKVIPTGNDKAIKVDKKTLVHTVDRIATIVNEEKNKLIKLMFANNKLTVQAQTSNGGFADESLAIDYDYEAELEIGFNPYFLLEALNQMESAEVILDLKNASSPVIIRDSENNKLFCILMPMRV